MGFVKRKNESPVGRLTPLTFVVEGEPASKANSRRLVKRGNRIASIKSAKALSYADTFRAQCPVLDEMFAGDVLLVCEVFYASRRPDLDISLIKDLLQGRVYANDRQVKVELCFWGLDPERPRTLLHVEPLAGRDSPGDLRHRLWQYLAAERGEGVDSDR